ncbi:MAG: bifunctional nuclease family protein [Kiritimatiellae bacterium]|nr:bifunctional nuclease family protein [Kiritimatiellia bacterium]
MILTTIRQLLLSNVGFVILLDNTEDERSLPIFIGAAEAQAIAFQLNNVDMPRPLTHDLFITTLTAVGYSIEKVEIYDLQDGTFFSNIILVNESSEITIDSRPSDAIALAIRSNAPIFVSKEVMDKAGRIFTDNDEETTAQQHTTGTQSQEKPLPHVPPLKKLEHSLEKAITDERYEDAAKLRDEINTLKDSHTGN